MTYAKPADKWILICALMLSAIGVLMVYSTTSVVSPSPRTSATGLFHFKKHLFTLGVSLMVMAAAYVVSPNTMKKYASGLLVFSLFLLLLVFVPALGVPGGGAKRWIRLWPSTFQPSELVKLSMVIFLAKFLSGLKKDRIGGFAHFAAPVAIMLSFQAVFLIQPDFGATMILGILTLSMLLISGAGLRYIIGLVLVSIPIIYRLLQAPYRRARLTSFLDPWADPRGTGHQLIQSFIALGSGGLTGVGLGGSKQKLSYLPEVHTDFIFSIIGEELGFITALIIVAIFGFLFYRGLRTAWENKQDPFVFYLAYGLSLMIALQALVNFFVTTGLAPTKGLPLPFISYGGSALLINMAAVGMLLNLSGFCGITEAGPADDKLSEAIKRKKARRAVYGAKR